MTSAQGDWTQY